MTIDHSHFCIREIPPFHEAPHFLKIIHGFKLTSLQLMNLVPCSTKNRNGGTEN